jgi:MFS family permease
MPDRPTSLRALWVGVGISALGTGLTLPFLVVYLHAVRHVPLTLAGLAVAADGLAALAVSPLAGQLADRLGPGKVMLAGLVLQGLSALGLAGVHDALQAGLVVAVGGLGNGCFWPAETALVAVLTPGPARTRAYAIQFTLMNAGIGLGGLVSGAVVSLANPTTFQLVYLADGASSLVFALVAGIGLAGSAGFAPSGRADTTPGAETEPGAETGPATTLPETGTDTGAAGEAGAEPARRGYAAVLGDRSFVRYLAVALGFILIGYSQVETGWSAFAVGHAGASPRVVGLAFAVNTAVIVGTQLLLVRRIGAARRSRVLAGVAGLWGISWALTGVASFSGLRGPVADVLLVAALGVFGLGETLYSPVGSALVNDLAPADLRGRYNALASNAWSGGTIVGAPIAGALLSLGGPVAWIGPLLGGAVVTCIAALRLGPVLGTRDRPPGSPGATAMGDH